MVTPFLSEVIQSAWQDDPRLRPSAASIVSVLEELQETLCATFVVDVMDELQICVHQPACAEGSSSGDIRGSSQFPGAAAADVLLDRHYVTTLVEATRMGHAWMDAGLLHHARHAHAFESSSTTSFYYFDVTNNAKLHQTIGATREPSSSIPMLAPATQSHQVTGDSNRRGHRVSRGRNLGTAGGLRIVDACACQKLGQRVAEEKTTRDKFRRKQFARRPPAEDLVLTTALLMDGDDDLDAVVGRGGSVTSSRGGQRLPEDSLGVW